MDESARMGRPIAWRRVALGLTALVTLAASFAILTAPIFPAPGETVQLNAGDVAPLDITAPRPITYVSEVLTAEARQAAENSVQDLFDPPDARIGRRQVEALRAALNFIDSVRSDGYATPEQKRADLSALSGVRLSADLAAILLAESDFEWEDVKDESLRVLELVMRGQVREDRLAEARRIMPTLVTIELSESQVTLVVGLVNDFIVPNSLYSETATAADREAARAAVQPVTQSFAAGQTVVLRGAVVTPADYEAMQQLGLIQPTPRRSGVLSAALAVLISGAILVLYVLRYRAETTAILSFRHMALFCSLFLLFLLAARIMVPGRTVIPFLFPTAALALILSVIFGPSFAIVTTVILGALVGHLGGNSLELTVFAAVGGLLATFTLGRAERVSDFLRAGLAVALGNAVVILIFRLPDGTTDAFGMATLIGASLFNGISATFSLPLLFVLGALFDITTSLQLVELARPNHPLLQFILRNAPGTYQHSLQVSNLAEQAAERVGANPMLIRVGALYHDCGKALHPELFVENQVDGVNPHEKLDPRASAKLIIAHIGEGMEMARRHRLPARIRDFIPEHHGTLLTRYQYTRALEAVGGDASRVDETDFRYHGPRPRSKETALLMLADGCEATVRANRPASVEEIDKIVKRILDDRAAQGQLDDTALTFSDLRLIRESFVTTLKGSFHGRILYPGDEPPTREATSNSQTQNANP